ncbi:MAG: hypothetical protein NUV50_14290 [Rhodospirillales bacterium]|nr:hypothetical protein [Rhodospirillales bacterium]
MHALYFMGYAAMATVAGLIIAQAQYSRMKTEGTPMNLGILKAIGGIALFMWTAAGLTSVAYSYTA